MEAEGAVCAIVWCHGHGRCRRPVDGEKRKREMRCDYGGKKSAIEIDSSIWREEIDAVEG
jgi:hypothetical protein